MNSPFSFPEVQAPAGKMSTKSIPRPHVIGTTKTPLYIKKKFLIVLNRDTQGKSTLRALLLSTPTNSEVRAEIEKPAFESSTKCFNPFSSHPRSEKRQGHQGPQSKSALKTSPSVQKSNKAVNPLNIETLQRLPELGKLSSIYISKL